MNAYMPHDWNVVAITVAIWAALILAVYLLNRFAIRPAWRIVSWGISIAGVAFVERLCSHEPAGVRMLAIIATLLYGMKAIVAVESRLNGKPALRPFAWLVFCCGWFGMRPSVFRRFPDNARDGWKRFLLNGTMTISVGIGLVLLARVVIGSSTLPEPRAWVAVGLLMVGLSLTVHFGLFDLLTGLWRRIGADCPKMFRAPLRSKSLTEFWSRRWNVAFSEMTALSVFRPAKNVVGPTPARIAAFLFSGLLHELAISVPVGSGYGLPFAYFTLHAVAMHLETTELVRRWMQSRVFAHAWVYAWIVLPLPVLFHRGFVDGVLLPLL